MNSDNSTPIKKGWRRALLTMLGGLAAAPAAPAAPAAAPADTSQPTPAQAQPRKMGNPAKAGRKGAAAESVVYKKVGNESLSLSLIRPAGTDAAGKAPCIVFFHGGGYRTGTPEKFRVMSQALADRGYLAISVQYRLLDEGNVIPKDAIEDGRSAMRYIRSHAASLGCHPDRIAAAGGSAGGHLALMTALKSPFDDRADDLAVSPKPAALILLNAGYNLARFKRPEAMVISPTQIVTADLPPTLMMHGTADKAVHFGEATEFREKATAAGAKDVTLVPFEGRGHGFFHAQKGDGSDFKTVIDQIDGFLRRLGWKS
jgi:acetyl esterase